MCIEADLAVVLCVRSSGSSTVSSSATRPSKAALRSYGTSGAGSAEEPGIVQRHGQGCVEALLSPRDPHFPLPDPKAARPSHHLKSHEPAPPIYLRVFTRRVRH